FDCSERACSIMAGVRSIPVTCRARFAAAQATMPGPQATSRTLDCGVTPAMSSSSCVASSWLGSRAKLAAWRVNWSTITADMSVLRLVLRVDPLHLARQLVQGADVGLGGSDHDVSVGA